MRGVSRFDPNPKAWVVENFGFLEITDFGVLYYTTQAYTTIWINLMTFGSILLLDVLYIRGFRNSTLQNVSRFQIYTNLINLNL